MLTETFTILTFGFILGIKHALDADHLIAVATMVSERKGFFSSTLVGTFWGIGHTLSLLVVGCVVVFLQLQIPEKLALAMEFAVAAMLILLGMNVLWKLRKGETVHMHVHTHHGHVHIHPHAHPFQTPHEHVDEISHHEKLPSRILHKAMRHVAEGKRPILIGMVHGMAGSAALMLVVLATIQTTTLALMYIAVFGIGSIGGMVVMSTVVGLPFVFTAKKTIALNRIVRGMAGVLSVVFGLLLAWQIGIGSGLLLP
jgi:high-affinity nickel permease